MLAAPPWITANSGYFLFGSKLAGLTIMLWIMRPSLALNQKCSGACQSMAAALAVLKEVSRFGAPTPKAYTSGGLTDDSHTPTMAVPPALSELMLPVAGEATSRGSPPL